MRLGHLEDARNSFAKAETILPSSDESLSANLDTLAEYEEEVEWNEAADEADDYSTQDIEKMTNDAIVLAESGNIVGALPHFERAAKHSARNSQMWLNLGVTQVKMCARHLRSKMDVSSQCCTLSTAQPIFSSYFFCFKMLLFHICFCSFR
jgi:tetratricopeptide (TPR) repeat protein